MARLCFVVTSPIGLRAFLRPHIEKLVKHHDVTVCVGSDEINVRAALPPQVRFRVVGIQRDISPVADIASLVKLYRFFRRGGFDLVYTLSPKAGLLGMIAAWLSRVPRRVHCFTGQVWVTRRGLSRVVLKRLDWLFARLATHLLADSHSQRDFLVQEGVIDALKIQVVARGSMAGIDIQRFRPDADARQRLRKTLNIPGDACCLLYVGRLKRDKGILDLIEAFERLRSRHPDLWLIVVGPDDEQLESLVSRQPGVLRVGYTEAVEEYMAAADIFCLPSYREGFGQVLVEAGATGLPSVASRIYGITDAVVEHSTGLLHEAGDVDGIGAQLARLIENPSLRAELGEAARNRAVEVFDQDVVTQAMGNFIAHTLQ